MDQKSLSIKVLYFSGCPSWKQTIEDLKFVLAEKGIKADLDVVRVKSDADAKKQKFPGSPTIRVNGRDLFPVDQPNYSLQCRVYPTPDGMKGTPTLDMLKAEFAK